MNWRRIPKEKTVQPKKGRYSDWKEILAEEGFNQCVYCAIPDACFGGIRNFHVEHYRPKSKFEKLENDIKNLFYACAICNTFKGDDWPGEPEKDFFAPCYPDPSLIRL
jgi:5-methylcytosine-specific restriction endonuclease McrA